MMKRQNDFFFRKIGRSSKSAGYFHMKWILYLSYKLHSDVFWNTRYLFMTNEISYDILTFIIIIKLH